MSILIQWVARRMDIYLNFCLRQSESLQLELVKHGAIPIFFNNLKALVQEGDDLAEVVLEALSGLTVNGWYFEMGSNYNGLLYIARSFEFDSSN